MYKFYDDISPSKIEIARQQIEAAIRAYLYCSNYIVVHTLAAPASQILRDLNKRNNRSASKAISDTCVEVGANAGCFWREFNENTANYLKHAGKPDAIPTSREDKSRQFGAIMFCICEFQALTGFVSPIMRIFASRHAATGKPEFGSRMLTLAEIWAIDSHTAFWVKVTRVLIMLRDKLALAENQTTGAKLHVHRIK
ncbi:MAG: hypothetical protein NW203_13780 [Hyphomonadaceae bacterium]|nr:hypothetical protein [Hyphomonadaceae bacterium]